MLQIEVPELCFERFENFTLQKLSCRTIKGVRENSCRMNAEQDCFRVEVQCMSVECCYEIECKAPKFKSRLLEYWQTQKL